MKTFGTACHGLFSAVLALLLVIPPVCQCVHGPANHLKAAQAAHCHCDKPKARSSSDSSRQNTPGEHSPECRNCTQRAVVTEKNKVELGSNDVGVWIPVFYPALPGFEVGHLYDASTASLPPEENAFKPLPREILYQNCALLI
jgi:hypothetical protein